jgi:hypothetical protein
MSPVPIPNELQLEKTQSRCEDAMLLYAKIGGKKEAGEIKAFDFPLLLLNSFPFASLKNEKVINSGSRFEREASFYARGF